MSGNLEISTVVGCRMMCTAYCPQEVHVQKYADKSNVFTLSLESFRRFIETVPSDVDIVFAGMAEPFLNKDCMEMIEYAHKKQHTLSIYTTCAGMKIEDVERLRPIPFHHFCLHLPDEEGMMHLKITDEYLAVVSATLPLSTNIMCIGNLHPKLRAVVGCNVSGSIAGLYSRGGNLKDRMIPRKKGALHCSACSEKLNHNILMPNGDVLLCCMDYAQDHVIGNLNQQTYPQLFESKEYLRVKAGLAGDESIDILCRKCEVSKS